MNNEFMTANEAAGYLRMNKNSLYILARKGVIPCIRPLPGKVLFLFEDMKAYLMSHRCASDDEILDKYKQNKPN